MEIQLESPRRSSSSPEFEFWMVGNAHPELQPNLLTADELFVDGVLLPLQLLSVAAESKPLGLDLETILKSEPKSQITETEEEKKSKPPSSSEEAVVVAATLAAAASIPPEASICFSSAPSISSSKRWKDIFKVGGGGEKKKESREEKDKKKERKSSNGGGGGIGGSAAELHINIWPFSRSWSAGTASGVRPKAAAAAAMRKSSSAPCSRSNSRGESTGGRRWAPSPGRSGVGVHVGRASPVWQARRGAGAGRAGPSREKGRKGLGLNGGGVRGLNLNVNSCIGYKNQVSCKGEECDASERGVNTNNNGGLFRFRALFSKKVY